MDQPILVTGGCGFVGFHIVSALLEQHLGSSVHVISRNPNKNLCHGAQYHAADISRIDQVQAVFGQIRPSLIIHTASPVIHGAHVKNSLFALTNMLGTRNLLEAAASCPSVKGFIFTSSTEVMEGSVHRLTKEDAPLRTLPGSKGDLYSKSKAAADQLVLDANRPGKFHTICLRPSGIYGERDGQHIPGSLKALESGHHKFQIGDNKNLFDVCSVGNVARVHVLAVKALLDSREHDGGIKVGGEAFFITDGKPIPFWDFERKIWAAAGVNVSQNEVTVVPAWMMLNLATFIEWVYRIFTLGQRKPETFRRNILEHTCLPKTYSIDKAKELLGYEPEDDRDEQIQKAVAWAQKSQ